MDAQEVIKIITEMMEARKNERKVWGFGFHPDLSNEHQKTVMMFCIQNDLHFCIDPDIQVHELRVYYEDKVSEETEYKPMWFPDNFLTGPIKKSDIKFNNSLSDNMYSSLFGKITSF